MPSFVLTSKDSDALQSTVFRAGPAGTKEAVAAFSSQASANQYLNDAEWGDSCTVAELQDADFVLWLCSAYQEGIQFVAVNPRRDDQMAGRPLQVIEIQPRLAEAGARIERMMESA